MSHWMENKWKYQIQPVDHWMTIILTQERVDRLKINPSEKPQRIREKPNTYYKNWKPYAPVKPLNIKKKTTNII